MSERERYAYLDIVKCVAMVSVCLYHFPLIAPAAYSDPLSASVLVSRFFRGMNAVCVPLFMMVNGALLLNSRFGLKKYALRTLKLFIGVYVWYILTQLVGHFARNGAEYVAQNLTGILYSALYLYEYDGIALTHLWFVQMLVAVYLLLPLLRAVIETGDRELKTGGAMFLGAMVCLCFLVHDFDHVKGVLPGLRYLDLSCLETMNPLRGIYGAMVVYFVLGGLLHRRQHMLQKAPLWLPLAMIAGGAAVLFIEWLLMTKRTESLYDIVYYGYNCLPTLSMSAGVFMLAARLAEKVLEAVRRTAAFIGRNTLAIYYTHWILGLLLLEGVSIPGSFAVNLLKALVMVLIGALIGEGMRRIPVLRHLI